MVEKDEILYVTGVDLGVNKTKENKKNTEGCEMNKRNRRSLMVTVGNSVLHSANNGTSNGVNFEVMEYIEEGRVIAKGEGVLCTVESYLTNYLGYDLKDLDSFYVWKDYPRNTNYEVSELGLVRNKNNGNYLQLSLKGEYEKANKNVWRLRVTIPGLPTMRVAQVVAETFLGEIPKEEGVVYVVGHKNDIPIDNRVDNLEYITSDENKTIDWVLREVVRRGLNTKHVNAVYQQIEEVLEDKYGEDFEVEELEDEDVLEVTENIDIYKRTVNEIYKYVKYGTGVLTRLVLFEGRFYV